MTKVEQTAAFISWLRDLRDEAARRKIVQRIARMEGGLFSDVKYFGGIGEMRVDTGPGYRVYFIKRGETLVILLCGGDKSSQQRDIQRAAVMALEV